MTIKDSLRKAAAEKQFKKSAKFEQIDISECRPGTVPGWMTRAYKNNMYVVMINDNAVTTHGKAIRAMVQKHDDTPFINHWSVMQAIKNEIFGKETTAIEYYPSESELIDHHNIYWMWIFPDDIIPKPIKNKV